MHRALIRKGDNFEEHFLSKQELIGWFREKGNVGDDGRVKKQIVLFEKCNLRKTESTAEKEERIEFVFSDMTLDRDAERIDPKGWKLDNYRKNPVVLWAHDMSTPAIGKAVNIRVENDQLVGEIEYDWDDPFAARIGNKVKKGFLNSGSVGFMPLRIELGDEKDAEERLIHREQELYEWSNVNVPSNVSATRRDLTAEAEKKITENILEKLKSSLSDDSPERGNYIDFIFSQELGDTSRKKKPGEKNEIERILTGGK